MKTDLKMKTVIKIIACVFTAIASANAQSPDAPPVPQPPQIPLTRQRTSTNISATNPATNLPVARTTTNVVLPSRTATNLGITSRTATNLNINSGTATNIAAQPLPTPATTGTNLMALPSSRTAATNLGTRSMMTTNMAAVPPVPTLPAMPGTKTPVTPTTPATTPAVPLPGQPTIPSGTAIPPVPGITAGQTNVIASATSTNIAATSGQGETNIIKKGLIRFQAQDLSAVLDFYAELVNKTVLRPQSLPDVKVTIKSQTDLTIDEAIRAINAVLAMNGISLVDVGDKFVKVVPEQNVFQQAKPFSSIDSVTNLPDMAPFVTVIRQVTNAKPSEVVQALQPFAKLQQGITPIDSSGIIVIRDYADNVKRMLEMLDKIDVAMPLEIEPVVIPIKYALASDIAQVLSSLSAGGGGGISVGRQTGTARTSTSSLSAGTGRTGFGTPGTPGFTPPGTTPGTTPTTTPGAAQSSFADRLRSIVQRASAAGELQILGQAKIIADERTNSLLIFADKRDMEMITNIIAKLDVVLAQVLIESLIMEVQLNNDKDYGLSYNQRRPARVGNFTGIGSIVNGSVLNPGSFSTIGTNAASALSGFSYFGRFSEDLDVTATAIARDSRYNVLSRPRILTSHAKEARIFVGQTRPYITGTYGGYYGYSPYSQYQQLPIGIELSVLPFINADGLVVMDIKQTIKDIGGEVKIDNNSVPITIDREAQAYVAVRDRDTVILGGFITSGTTKSSSGVPILKDIPLLGGLFKSQSSKKNRNELVVLIRPTVLPSPELAAKATEEDKNLMPGIKRAEWEAEEIRAKEAEQLQKDLEKRQKEQEKKESKKSKKN